MTPEEIFYRTRDALIEKHGAGFLNLDEEAQYNLVLETIRGFLGLEKGGTR